jgi:hypothetical protein
MCIVRLVVVSLTFCLTIPAFAADIEVGPGIICDTKEQAERFIFFFKGNVGDALTSVNAEAHQDNACASAAIAYLPGEVSTTARNDEGAFRVTEILVLGVVTPLGVQQVSPFPQFTIKKIEEISI